MKPNDTVVLVEGNATEARWLATMFESDDLLVVPMAARWEVLSFLASPVPVTSVVLGPGARGQEGELLARTARWLRPGIPIIVLGTELDLADKLCDLSPPARVFSQPGEGLA